MAEYNELKTKIVLKNGTASELKAKNPVLLKGEMCIEIDTNKFKFGDGVTAYNELPYAVDITLDADHVFMIADIRTLQTRVGTADDSAAADGSLFARIKQLDEDLTAGLAEAGKIDSITVNGEAVTIEGKTAQIVLPAAFISSLAEGEDNLVVEEGKLKLAKVSTDKLVNGENVLVLNGGGAND